MDDFSLTKDEIVNVVFGPIPTFGEPRILFVSHLVSKSFDQIGYAITSRAPKTILRCQVDICFESVIGDGRGRFFVHDLTITCLRRTIHSSGAK